MELEDKIKAIWKDENLAEDIKLVLIENNLSLEKLISCCSRKGQNITEAMGAVLAMNDSNFVILQCQCGEIVSFNDKTYGKYIEEYGEKILCKRCDPAFMQKMQSLSGGSVSEFEFSKKWK